MSNETKVHFRLQQDAEGYPPVAVESVWAEATGRPDEFRIDNVPFFAREATIGDVVRAPLAEGGNWLERVMSRSANSLIRVTFFEESAFDGVREKMKQLGCDDEYLEEHGLLAVTVPASASLSAVQGYLQVEADAGRLDYEEPILRSTA